MTGCVYFVGAGPGDPELITSKALRILKQADVVISDHDVHPYLLRHVDKQTEILYVDKALDPLEAIKHLIGEKAKSGKNVVRLINGDSWILGRGGEEVIYLASLQIPFEIVPGVPPITAALAYAGIPVSPDPIRSSFAVFTELQQEALWADWDRLVKSVKTLLFLIKLEELPILVQKLRKANQPSTTPIALIQRAGTINQKVVVGHLGEIEQKVDPSSPQSSITVIMGQGIHMREQLQWLEKKPLFGWRIVITRSAGQNQLLAERIRALGGEPLEFPMVKIVPPKRGQQMDQALKRVDQFDWLVFTSVHGVKFFLQRMKEMNIDIRRLGRAKIAVVGPKTKQAVEEYGLFVECMPREHVAEALVETMRLVVAKGERILLPRSNIARDVLPIELKKMGCQVEAVDAYDTVLEDKHQHAIIQELQQGSVHMITFTSSSTVRNFHQLLAGATSSWEEWMKNVKVACIGPITARTAEELGFRVDVVADSYTIDGLVEAIQSIVYKTSQKKGD